jgi:hypothetical protein
MKEAETMQGCKAPPQKKTIFNILKKVKTLHI